MQVIKYNAGFILLLNNCEICNSYI